MPIGFHPMEVILLVVIALLFFGPKRLVEMGSAVGKTVREFQNALHEGKETSSDVPSPDDASTTLPSAKEHVDDPQQIAAPSVSVSNASSEPTAPAVTRTAAVESPDEKREEHVLSG